MFTRNPRSRLDNIYDTLFKVLDTDLTFPQRYKLECQFGKGEKNALLILGVWRTRNTSSVRRKCGQPAHQEIHPASVPETPDRDTWQKGVETAPAENISAGLSVQEHIENQFRNILNYEDFQPYFASHEMSEPGYALPFPAFLESAGGNRLDEMRRARFHWLAHNDNHIDPEKLAAG